MTNAEPVKLGLEVLVEEKLNLLAGKRVGLVTNHTGVNRYLESTIDILNRNSKVEIVALYGPEHGVRGDAQAGQKVDSYSDPETGIKVYSLYGDTKKPTPEMLEDVDVLVYDIQDAGCRFYTYLYTMGYVLEAAAENDLPVIVLDRPNPITGTRPEGNILDLKFRSFVGNYPIPMRTAVTIGEAALLFNFEFGIGADLTVVPMQGWKRSMWYDQTGLPFVPPSPNCPTLDCLLLYPGTCLFEGTNLSEGRGTTRPFEIIGAPWLKAEQAARELNSLALPGVLFRPVYFTPTFSKHEGEKCAGVQIHVIDREAVQAVTVGLHTLVTLKKLSGDRFAWRQPASGGTCFIDLLAGTDNLRCDLDQGRPAADILAEWQKQLQEFLPRREKHLLYE